MKTFLLILAVIFAFGIGITSSSISYSDYINHSINSSIIKNQEQNKNDKVSKITQARILFPTTSYQITSKEY